MSNEAPSIHTTAGKLNELRRRLGEAHAPLGQDVIDQLHAAGQRTARERCEALFDEGSFVETDALAKSRSNSYELAQFKPVGDGVVTGYGTVDGRSVCVFSADATVMNGSFGEVTGEKIVKIQQLAIKTGRPLVTILDGTGARPQEGITSLAFYGEIMNRLVQGSGLIPQIAIALGDNLGDNVLLSALQDVVVTVRGTSQLAESDLTHYAAEDEDDALTFTKELLAYLPSNNRGTAPQAPAEKSAGAPGSHPRAEDLELNDLIPDSDSATYDMLDVLQRVVDDGSFLQLQAQHATNIITGFARLEGRAVAIVGNQPLAKAGGLDALAAEKAARFVRLCDCFNVPLLTFVDVPGFLPDEDRKAQVLSIAKLLYAYGEAVMPRVTVVVRKAFGEAYNVMGSKHLGADVNLAWPTAQIALDDAENAVEKLQQKRLAEAAENEEEDVDDVRARLIAEYEQQSVNPYVAAERGYVDSVIPPSHTRDELVVALRLLERKVVNEYPKRHGNTPL